MDQDISNFMDITGCLQVEEAQKYLEFGEGNLEHAIQLYFASAPAVITEPTRVVEAPINSPSIRSPIAPVMQRLSENINFGNQDSSDYEDAIDPFNTNDSTENEDFLAKMFEPPYELMFRGGSIEMVTC